MLWLHEYNLENSNIKILDKLPNRRKIEITPIGGFYDRLFTPRRKHMIDKNDQSIGKNKAVTISMILTLALPAIIENVLQVFLGVADTYFVSKLGTEAIAAVGATNLTMNLFISLFLAVSVGATAVISRYVGGNNTKQAVNSSKQALILGLFIGAVFGVVNVIFAPQIMSMLGAEDAALAYSIPYYRIVAGPLFLVGGIYALSSTLRASGDTKSPMKAAAISNVVNIILDYILIFGIFNIPGMGIKGAALATTIARCVNLILLIRVLGGYNSPLHIDFTSKWTIERKTIKAILKIGFPAAIEKIIMRSGQLLYGGMIISIGTAAYAAHNIAGTIESFSYLPGMGFGVAAATLVGQQLGAKQKSQAVKAGKLSYMLGTGLMMMVGLVFFVFARPLATLFSKDKEVIDQVVIVLRIIACFQPFLSSTLVTTSALQGGGDTKFPMYISLLGIWGVRVLGVYILSIKLGFGLVGVWSAYALDVTIRGTILWKRFMNGRWLSSNVV